VRRGFVAEAQRLALEVRAELGLDHREQLDPYGLADLYGIHVYCLQDLIEHGGSHAAVDHFAGVRQATFSAALVPIGPVRLIIENEAHTPTRRRASIAHEMAHILLEHQFASALLNFDGCRAFDKAIEAEADRLGGELLIPFRAALAAARAGLTDERVAEYYGVSREFAGMRMNASGARKVAARQLGACRRVVTARR
jgi:hypothetical protein